MTKYVEDMTVEELARELVDGEGWMKAYGHTLNCGDQDAAGDRLDQVRAELRERTQTRCPDHREFNCFPCQRFYGDVEPIEDEAF